MIKRKLTCFRTATQTAEQKFSDVQAQHKQANGNLELKIQVDQQQQKAADGGKLSSWCKNVLRIEQQKQTLPTQTTQIRVRFR